MKRTLAVIAALLASTVAFAQSPYSGMQTRPIKALSEQQVADLKAGRGMGLALAAELNGYPGPSHVLELADKLDLSADQRTSVRGICRQIAISSHFGALAQFRVEISAILA